MMRDPRVAHGPGLLTAGRNQLNFASPASYAETSPLLPHHLDLSVHRISIRYGIPLLLDVHRLAS